MARRRITKEILKERFYRRRFLIPNAVTLGNMFCGFLAIMYAATGRFEKAVIATGFAILLDGLDGRVARKLNATSRFGVELDSFSDLVSFGVAPAIMIYHWCFYPGADELGIPFTFIYTLCAASRLARFNISQENLKGFEGLPTPGAAGMVAACVNFAPYIENVNLRLGLGIILMPTLAFLMVSRIEFFSIKTLKLSRMRAISRIMLGLLIALIWYRHQIGLFVLAGAYCASGPWNLIRNRGKRKSDPEVVKLRQINE